VNCPDESKPPAAPEASGKPTAEPKPRAPKPVTMLSGTRGSSFTPKASKVPHDPPDHFPNGLWPRTNLILLKARKAFPVQEQAFELCKHVIYEMTPLFVEAVKSGRMKAYNVQKEYGGGMYDLLRLLLVCNDPGPQSGWGLSDAAYRLGERVRNSAEWERQAEAIVEAEHGGQPSPTEGAGSAMRDSDETSSQVLTAQAVDADRFPGLGWGQGIPPAQGKMATDAKGKSEAASRRKAFLIPILEKKAFSINDWATQAGVDFHTANNYLNGETNPYRGTLAKLASPLGLEVTDMPA
jgi:hypothetical protein